MVFNMVYNESAKVDSKFSDVVDIAPGKDNLRVKVRVIRMWKVPAFLNPSNYSSLEMVLVDKKVRYVFFGRSYGYFASINLLPCVLHNSVLDLIRHLCCRVGRFMRL
jgi:hypothetical protein